MKVYTIGYAVAGAARRVNELMAFPLVLLVDIRYSPHSKKWPEWEQQALMQRYKGRYCWLQWLGNEHYRDREKPIKLMNAAAGIRRLRWYLAAGWSVILLCGCKNYETCHRRLVVELLQRELPDVEVVVEPEGGLR